MADKNEIYVYESEEAADVKDRVIVRTHDAPMTEKFTINRLEKEIARMEEEKIRIDERIAKIQEKIEEATVALE